MTTQHVASTRALGFASLDHEVKIDHLPVRGELPAWLSGTLMRPTPALLDVGAVPVGHWFDGRGMLNAFSFADGRVSYVNRFLQTDSYRQARRGRNDRAVSMGTDPCRHLGQRLMALFDPSLLGEPHVNVARLGQRYLTLTESTAPVEFDPQTLSTQGYVSLRDSVRDFHGAFAHPHFDLTTGELITYVTRIGLRNEHRIIAVAPDSLNRREIGTVPAGNKPAYMHSFAMTARYIVLVEQPLSYSLSGILRSGKFQDGYRWNPEHGTRFVVIDRRTGEQRGEYQGEAFFYWHQVNAFDNGNEVVLDLVASDDPSSVWDLDLVKLRNPSHRPEFYGHLRRYRIPLSGGRVVDEQLSDLRLEFPQINYGRCHTRSYQYAYAIAYRTPESDWFDQLVKVDVASGEYMQWSEEGCYPSEPVFVQAPNADTEDAGVILNIVLDSQVGRSFLLILDAITFDELARAEIPHHIPFNFHQQYFSS